MTEPHTRCAVVTGASRGIGRHVAERLAAAGWALTLCARSEGPLRELADELRKEHGTRSAVAAADMADPESAAAVAAAHAATHDRLDLLVVNAGMGSIGPFAQFAPRRFEKLWAVNVHAPFVLVQRLLPMLRRTAEDHGVARIVAVSSLTGVAGEPLNSAYGATKAALTSLCETLNTEESESGVNATAVCPGYVATDMTAPLADGIEGAPMIDPADVASVVVGLTALSRSVVVPVVPMMRPGPHLWRA